jgi:predicted nucleic acid-binding protein
MILADSSIWTGHLNEADADLIALLEQSQVVTHPMIIDEVALTATRNRDLLIGLLDNLPTVPVATQDELRDFVTRAGLFGHGLGLVGAHLLASTRLAPECLLWTRDARLAAAARALGCAWMPAPHEER